MLVVFSKVKEFMMEKYLNLENILKDCFFQQQTLGFKIPYSVDEIDKASIETISVQKVKNGYVRPVAWRGSEMMAISAQQTKIHVAIAAWDWGTYYADDIRLKGIKLDISKWRRAASKYGSMQN